MTVGLNSIFRATRSGWGVASPSACGGCGGCGLRSAVWTRAGLMFMTGCLLISVVLVGWTYLYDGRLANMVKRRPVRNSLNTIHPDRHRINRGTVTPKPILRSSADDSVTSASPVAFPDADGVAVCVVVAELVLRKVNMPIDVAVAVIVPGFALNVGVGLKECD